MYTEYLYLSICVQRSSWRRMQLIWESFIRRSKIWLENRVNGLIVVTYKGDILCKYFKSGCERINFTRTWSQKGNVRKVVGVQGSAF